MNYKDQWYLKNDIYYIPIDFKLDLQRFANAESEGRTEKATEHKKRKAREEGRVALSHDLPATIITLFSFIAIYFMANFIYKTFHEVFVYFFENLYRIELRSSEVFYDFFLIPFAKIFLPIAIVAFLVSIL